MRINVKQLRSGGNEGEITLEFDYALDLSDTVRWGTHPFPSPVRVWGTVCDRSGIRTVDYKASFIREELCSRCLETVNRSVEAVFSHILVETDDADKDYGDDFIPVCGGILDMDELASADILLSQDGALLCREDCKGLCPKCGANLNDSTCACELKEPDARFAKLFELMKSDGDGGNTDSK